MISNTSSFNFVGEASLKEIRTNRVVRSRPRRGRIVQYPIVIYPCEEGGYVAEIPALKGCLAQGETLDEVLSELKLVAELWLETAEKYDQQLPDVADSIEKIKLLSI